MQPPLYSIKDFAAKIKAKYPEYKDVDDNTLVQKITDKYPEYKRQLDPTEFDASKKKVGSQNLSTSSNTSTNTNLSLGGEKNKNVYDPVKNILDQHRQQLQQAQTLFDPYRNRSVSDQTRQNVLPVGVKNTMFEQSDFNQKKVNENVAINNLTQAETAIKKQFKNVNLAKSTLEKVKENNGGIIPKDNETAQIAQQAINEHEPIVKDLTAKANKSKNLDEFLRLYTGGGLPIVNEGTKATEMAKLLDDPDVEVALKQNHNLWNEYLRAKSDFNNKYPNVAKQKIASQVAQWREDEGQNSVIYNNPSKENLDKLVEDKYNKGEMSASDRAFYYQNIKPSDIPTTGILNEFGRNYEQATRNSQFGRLLSSVGLLENPQDKYEFQAQVKPTKHPILAGSAELMGQITPMILNSTALKGAGFSDKQAGLLAGVNQFMGGNEDESKKLFPKDRVKQLAYTGLATFFDAAAMEMPLGKARAGVSQFLKKEATPLVNTLMDNTISDAVKQDARNSFINRFQNFVGATVKNTASTAGVLTGYDLVHKGLRYIGGDPSAGDELANTNIVQTYLENAEKAPILGAVQSLGKLVPEQKTELHSAINELPDGVYTTPLKEALKKGDEAGIGTYLNNIAEQVSNPQSKTFTRKIFGDKLSDIATKLYPNAKSESINVEQPTNTTTPTTEQNRAEVRDTKDEQAGVNTTDNGLQDGNSGSGKDVGGEKGVKVLMPDEVKKPNVIEPVKRKNIVPNDNYRTMDMGNDEGKPETKEARKQMKDRFVQGDIPIDGENGKGETGKQFAARVLTEWENNKNTEPNNTTIISHSSVLKAIKAWETIPKEERGDPSNMSDETWKKFADNYVKESTENGDLETFKGKNGDIHVIRHGQTEDNKEGNFRSANTNLTDKGIEQAKEVGKQLNEKTGGDVPKIISSSLPRTIHTSDLVHNEFGNDNVKKASILEESYNRLKEGGADENESEMKKMKGRIYELKSTNKPPSKEPPVENKGIYVERPATELSHRGLQDVANEFSLSDVEGRDTKTDIQLRKDAENTINDLREKGEYGNKIEELTKKAENKGVLNDEERVIMEQHLANVIGEARKLDKNSSEYDAKLQEIKRLKDAGEITRSAAGAALRIPTNSGSYPRTVEDAMVDRMNSLGAETLTIEQKKDVEEKFAELEKNLADEKAKREDAERKNAELIAQLEVANAKKAAKPAKKDFKKEREDIRASIREKLKKSRSQANDVTTAIVDFAKIAPDVAKLMKSYVEEGIVTFSELIDKLHNDLKEDAPEIKREDVVDIIAGKYDTPKETKIELLNKLKQIKDKKSAEAIKIKAKLESGDFERKTKPKSWVDNPEFAKKYPKEYKDALDAIRRVDDAKHEMAIANLKAEMEKRSKWQKLVAQGGKALRTAKALKAGIDFSATLVQNLLAIMAHPIIGARGTKEAFLDLASANRFERGLARLHNSEAWPLIEKSELSVVDPKSLRENEKNDIFNDTFFDDMKIKGKSIAPTKPFERHFTSLGNYIRVNLFLRKAEKLFEEGKTFETHPEDFKSVAATINNMTGRGTMTEGLESHNELLSSILWSPRLLASTFNVLGIGDAALAMTGKKGFYRSLTPSQRAYAATEIGKGIGMGIAVMAAIAYATGGNADLNPTSVTFGTVQNGDNRWTVFGRFTSVIRMLAMLLSRQRTTERGTQELDSNKYGATTGNELWKFVRGKMNPSLSYGVDIATNTTFQGSKPTLMGELKNALYPMAISDVVAGIQQDGMKGFLVRGIPSTFGAKVSNENDFIQQNTFQQKAKINGEERIMTDSEFQKFAEKKKEIEQSEIEKFKKMGMYVTENGQPIFKTYNQLSSKQRQDKINAISISASKKAKENIFGSQKESNQEKHAQSKVEKLNDKLYK